jgi:hypothetical protein
MDLALTTETIGQDDQRWLGSAHGTSAGDAITLDASAFTAGTHYPNGYLPSGTCLSLNSSVSNKYGPYTTGGANGTGTALGFLLTPVQIKSGTSTPSGALYWHGEVVTANLPFTSGTGSIDATGKGQLPQIKFV